MPGYMSLPYEVLESILKRLDCITIVKYMRAWTCYSFFGTRLIPQTVQVCRKTYRVIKSSRLLNYIIELEIAGYIHNLSSVVGLGQRISLLAERNRYWKEMAWNDRFTLESKGNFYSQNPNRMMFARGTILRKGTREFEDAGTKKRTHELTPIRMFKGNTAYLPLSFNIDANQTVLGIDIGQDLLVLLTIIEPSKMSLQFLHLGTMLPHPKAAVPKFALPGATLVHSGGTQILEDICSITRNSGPFLRILDTIEVFDWKKGERLLTSQRHPPIRLLPSFRLLSPSHYIIISWQNRWGDYGVHGEYAIQIRLVENDLLLATYQLPPFASKWRIAAVTCQAESTSKLDGDSIFPFQSPFISAPHPKILLFNIRLWGGPSPSLDLVVLPTCFFPNADQLEISPDNIIPWSAWGPQNTRLFVDGGFGPSVHMYRICTEDSLMDFNPIDIARDICLGNDGNIQQEATVLPKSKGLFKEDLITSLPYRVVKHRIPSDEFSHATIGLDDCIFVLEEQKRFHSFL